MDTDRDDGVSGRSRRNAPRLGNACLLERSSSPARKLAETSNLRDRIIMLTSLPRDLRLCLTSDPADSWPVILFQLALALTTRQLLDHGGDVPAGRR